MSAMDERLCDEAVPDADGVEEPCERPAVGWHIDEENQPYPVCVIHHRWPYADEWVAAEAALGRVRALGEEWKRRSRSGEIPPGAASEDFRQAYWSGVAAGQRACGAELRDALDGGTE